MDPLRDQGRSAGYAAAINFETAIEISTATETWRNNPILIDIIYCIWGIDLEISVFITKFMQKC